MEIKCFDCDIVVKPFNTKNIKYAFHDIDGTHSLIREWQPVMSIVLDYVSNNGLQIDYDNDDNVKKLVRLAGSKPLPETDLFCVESAGLSALTQMEWAIRKAIDSGVIQIKCDKVDNKNKLELIRKGQEVFDSPDSKELQNYLNVHTPRLFKFYEKVLNGYCRDKNLLVAKDNPEKFMVKGSMEFMTSLYNNNVQNFFVTGAVVEKGVGMYEEVVALGYNIGKHELVEGLVGSTWTEKLPKDLIMAKLKEKLGARGDEILVVGDGRSEISAGVNMGALNVSRLDIDDVFRRDLHKKLGTNIIVSDYTDKNFKKLFKIK